MALSNSGTEKSQSEKIYFEKASLKILLLIVQVEITNFCLENIL